MFITMSDGRYFDRPLRIIKYPFTCVRRLPLEEGIVYAEVPLTGRKKKEAIAACALEACRMLDRLGQFDANRGRSLSHSFNLALLHCS